MLIATNSGRTKVWKFNPYHDRSSGQFTSGGGGGSSAGHSRADIEGSTKAVHASLLPKTLPNGVTKGATSFGPSSDLFGAGSRDVETTFHGSKGKAVFRTEPVHGGNDFKGAHVIQTGSGRKRFSGELAYQQNSAGLSPVTVALTRALNGIA